jgi:hypothetical protein
MIKKLFLKFFNCLIVIFFITSCVNAPRHVPLFDGGDWESMGRQKDKNNNSENTSHRDLISSARIKAALIDEYLPVNKIGISVKNGVLYLSGKVTILEGKKIIEVVKNNSDNNILNVVNLFDYSGGDNLSKETIEKENTIKKNLSLIVENTQVNSDGNFVLNIYANSPVSSLTINGEEQGRSTDGRYSVKRIARVGQASLYIIVATDINGNTDTKTITVSRTITDSKPVVAALNPTKVKKQPERDSVAIIIGIADYKNLPRADYANDDARVFYDYAIRALGVKPENIRLLVDGDADDIGIYQAFKTWLPSRVRAGTDVYVYYSGHGLPTADGQGLYLLPQRAHRDFIDKTAITQAEINAAIQAAKPKSVTVFLDACYSGQARSGETLIASARPVALKTAKQLFPDNFTVITASQADQISSSSQNLKHGIFSYYLMLGMEGDADANKDGKITAGEMQAYLAENVSRQAGMQNRVQQPQLIGDANKVLMGR